MTNKKNSALKMLENALEMEEKGKNFYEKAANTCNNELGREMFKSLLADELVHIDRIREIFQSIKCHNEWTDEWKTIKSKGANLKKLFTDFSKKHGSKIKSDTRDLEALSIGIDLELRSIQYYEDHLKKAEDLMERSFIEQMITEEHKHHEILVDAKLYLSDPASWFVESEHTSLDGG